MVARVNTVSFQGIDVKAVDVQVQLSNGLPAFNIVGLPDKAVAESKERVRAALHALGLSLPPKRLTVNMAPADLGKEGSHFDLPIALGVLGAMGVIPKEELGRYVVLGELSLDASIRSVSGVLPAAMHASESDRDLICPKECGGEAAWAGDLDIIAPNDLLQLINHIKGTQLLGRPEAKLANDNALNIPDLSHVKGQESAKRALEITAAGGHNLLMIGAPGSGKSMLASCLPGILPPLSPKEALELSMVHSLAGVLPEGGLIRQRPFRAPHHSASQPALIGGGQKVRPGEISLAHHGVLFLDELPEFSRATLESLRQPLETGDALVARANAHIRYPARFQLIAAMNPCRCGYLGDNDMACTKAPRCGVDYQSKISGPLMDRIDIHVDVPPVQIADLHGVKAGDTSEVVAARVFAAREVQRVRYQRLGMKGSAFVNANATGEILDLVSNMSAETRDILTKAAERAKLSARGYYRILKVARTISDLNGGAKMLCTADIAEALSYRRMAVCG
ncbi:MAG: AAA family ATPase [Alphaproteobacteria bacterium]|nr:MAG: AAA family ATPase [Alphaproteobacteria bacterium]